MVTTLRQTDPDFEQKFAAFLSGKREVSEDVDRAVREIVDRVRREGDSALLDYSRRFDRIDLEKTGIAVTEAEIDAAFDAAPASTVEALKLARDRIEKHHARQLPKDDRYTDALGVELGSRWTAIKAVGLYVPGGTASYPSSVLMNAMPAKVAGVDRIVMVVPAPDGNLNPLVLVAARLAGVSEIYRVGARRPLPPLPMAPKRSVPSPRSSAPAMPMWQRQSASYSERSAST